jgi:hypothetical protein
MDSVRPRARCATARQRSKQRSGGTVSNPRAAGNAGARRCHVATAFGDEC